MVDFLEAKIKNRDQKFKEMFDELELLKTNKDVNQTCMKSMYKASHNMWKIVDAHVPNIRLSGIGYNNVPPPSTGFFKKTNID